MSIALDFGASTIVSLRRTGERLIARSSRLEYAVLPDSPAHRRLLERGQVSFLTCESNLVLVGDAAHENADLFRTPCRPLLVNGRVPENDPLARQVIARLTESVLPPAQERDDICAVTLPGDVTLDGSDTRSDFEFLTQIIRLQGYDPLLVPSGQALVLAELVRSAFTGIGLTFGHAGCEALLAHRGAALCHASTRLGGEWLDQQLLTHMRSAAPGDSAPIPIFSSDPGEADQLTRQLITDRRENLSALVNSAADSQDVQLIASLLAESLSTLLQDFAAELNRSPQALDIPQPLPIVCTGGLARTPGFGTLLVQALKKHRLPVETCEPRLVTECPQTIARGLLIAAELESSTRSASKAA
jgi:hypothetical protein